MKLKQVIDTLELRPFFLSADAEEVEAEAAYCGDLMSDVLANIPPHGLWFTVQSHINVIAVAQLRDVACIVLVNGVKPDPQTVEKARSQNINLCGSDRASASLCMKLAGAIGDVA